MTDEQKQEIAENGLLSELAYLKLENYNKSLENTEDLQKFIEDNPEKVTGIDPNRKEQMKSLLNKYDIVKVSKPSLTDFQGTLVKEKGTNEYTTLFRKTRLHLTQDNFS